MSKFKPFEVVEVTRAMVGDYDGLYISDPNLYKAISDRRHGIIVDVIPRKKNGKVVWKWSAEQKSAKLTGNGYKFSNYSRQWQEGYTDTFEEGQRIVTELYKEWMDARPTTI